MSRLGKYEILELIGTGSMGTVSRARDTMIDREVALKTIRTGTDIDPEIRERFYREARSCGRLHHPNIVTIFDLGEEDQTAFIAMELLEGTDFRALIKDRRAATIPEKLEWMSQVCDALGHAHESGVIHRDVKPSNLFLTKKDCVKVLDFGIAKLPSSQLTLTGKILGTPNYMAPEQILAKPTDGRSDLFSAVVVLFELLAYQHPFRGNLVPQRIVQSEPDSLTALGVSVPASLEKLLKRGLAKNPDDRYATGGQLAKDLRMIADAVRRNDPVALSTASLPSDQEPAAVDVSPQSDLAGPLAEVPDGEDAAEWRYSQVLDLLPQFEAALRDDNSADANRHFNSLLRVTGGDTRFNQAIVSCRARLNSMNPPEAPDRSTKPEVMAVSAAARVSTANRSASNLSTRPLEDDSILTPVLRPPVRPIPEKPPPAPVTAGNRTSWDDETLFDRTGLAAIGSLKPKMDKAPSPSQPQATKIPDSGKKGPPWRITEWIMTHPKQAVADVAAVVFLIAGILLFRVYFSVPNMEHAVAVARASDRLIVRKSADAKASEMYSLKQGDDINVLNLPESRSSSWVKVQKISAGKTMKPGFAQTALLSDWKGADAASGYALFKTFHDTTPVTEAEMNDRAIALADFSSQYAGSAEAARAKTDELEMRYLIIRNKEKNGLTGEPLRTELQSLLNQTQKAGESGNRLRNELTAKLAEQPSVTPSPTPLPHVGGVPGTSPGPLTAKPSPPVDVASLIAQGEQQFNNGNYEAAMQTARRVLRRESSNSAAKGLLDRAQRAANAEK